MKKNKVNNASDTPVKISQLHADMLSAYNDISLKVNRSKAIICSLIQDIENENDSWMLDQVLENLELILKRSEDGFCHESVNGGVK